MTDKRIARALARDLLERNMPGKEGSPNLRMWPSKLERAVALADIMDRSGCTGQLDKSLLIRHDGSCPVHREELRS